MVNGVGERTRETMRGEPDRGERERVSERESERARERERERVIERGGGCHLLPPDA